IRHNGGGIHARRGILDRGEEFYRRSLDIEARVVGPDNYFVAPVLQNLGIVARERKDYPTALAYYARVLSIRERTVGPNHPDVAQVLNNMTPIAPPQTNLTPSPQLHFPP